jgi:hypothetical protein
MSINLNMDWKAFGLMCGFRIERDCGRYIICQLYKRDAQQNMVVEDCAESTCPLIDRSEEGK